jgi:hypothetical protein
VRPRAAPQSMLEAPLSAFADALSHGQRASDRAVVEAYRRLGSVQAAGAELRMGPGSVHERLVRLGAARAINVFTAAEDDRLRAEYWICADAGRLGALAADMRREKTILCMRAKQLGLTKRDRAKPYHAVWKYVAEDYARTIFEKFKQSSFNLSQFCQKLNYDRLGFSRCMRKFFPDEWEHVIESKQIRQTKYRYGRQFEYLVRDDMKAAGYFALRSPASKTPIDVLAIRPGAVIMIQCKRNGACGVEEWNTLLALAASCGALPVLASLPVPRGGIVYELITGPKDGSKRRQPKEPWSPKLVVTVRPIADSLL